MDTLTPTRQLCFSASPLASTPPVPDTALRITGVVNAATEAVTETVVRPAAPDIAPSAQPTRSVEHQVSDSSAEKQSPRVTVSEAAVENLPTVQPLPAWEDTTTEFNPENTLFDDEADVSATISQRPRPAATQYHADNINDEHCAAIPPPASMQLLTQMSDPGVVVIRPRRSTVVALGGADEFSQMCRDSSDGEDATFDTPPPLKLLRRQGAEVDGDSAFAMITSEAPVAANGGSATRSKRLREEEITKEDDRLFEDTWVSSQMWNIPEPATIERPTQVADGEDVGNVAREFSGSPPGLVPEPDQPTFIRGATEWAREAQDFFSFIDNRKLLVTEEDTTDAVAS